MKLDLPDRDFAGFIFDCDGTLADTMPLHYEAWIEAIEPYGAKFPEPYFYQLGGTKTHRIVEMLNEQQNLSMPIQEVVHHKEHLFLERLPRVHAIQTVVDFLLLKKKTHPVAVASGGELWLVSRTLHFIGLEGVFDAIVTADDVVHGKPAPDTFLLAAKRLGVPSGECLVFEDAPTGIEAARNAGMPWVLVPSARA